ncbi:hypothetical protein BV22DRAFT_1036641 [Leucogyrophana mollusca]|uniref:Uncharacterized protein n=1 Tax=Leucogyrophana mollusca TaxID=85980 RepID=A0ACB8BD37_9AGAM|nr:hypothetical protein BV22DRAFT_1036641 [Leucogyrophana mollusca]
MSTANPITFFDLASTVGPFSPLTWRTRYVLNYKNIPYRTEWVGFADVETVLVSNGVPPTSATKPKYTVPAIIDSKVGQEPAIVADSPLIADYLESTYPANSIYPDGSRDLQHKHVNVINANLLRPIVPMVLAVTATVFEARDRDAFVTSRTQDFGAQ